MSTPASADLGAISHFGWLRSRAVMRGDLKAPWKVPSPPVSAQAGATAPSSVEGLVK